MTLLLYLLPLVLLVRILNKWRIQNVTLAAENKVRSLRNELRLKAIEGKINTNLASFQMMDYAIASAEAKIQDINLWLLLYKTFIKRDIVKENSAKAEIFSFERQPEIKKFYESFADISVKYLIKKNLFSLFITAIVMKFAKHTSTKIKKWLVNSLNNIKLHLLIMEQNHFAANC